MARRNSSASPPVKSRRDHGHAQQLLLKQRHAQRPPQHRLERRMQASRLLPSLPPPQIRMHHLAHNRPRPDDGHLHHDVVETLPAAAAAGMTSARGSPPGTCRWCPPSAALRKPPDRPPADAPDPLLRRTIRGSAPGTPRCTAIMPSPSRSTLMMPRSAQSSLSHCTTTRPGMVAGSSGTTESSWPWQITMPPECWPRCRGRSCTAWYSSRNLRTRGLFRSRSGIAEMPLRRVAGILPFPRPHQARQTIERHQSRSPAPCPPRAPRISRDR